MRRLCRSPSALSAPRHSGSRLRFPGGGSWRGVWGERSSRCSAFPSRGLSPHRRRAVPPLSAPPPLRAGPFVVRPRIMNGRAERREGARGAEGAWPKAAWAEESGRPRPHFATWGSEPLLPLAEPADVGEPCGRGLVGTAGGAGVNEGEAPPPGRCYIGAAPAPRPPGARRAVRGAAGSAGPAPGAAPPSSRTAPLRTPPDSTRPDPTRAGIYYSHSGGGKEGFRSPFLKSFSAGNAAPRRVPPRTARFGAPRVRRSLSRTDRLTPPPPPPQAAWSRSPALGAAAAGPPPATLSPRSAPSTSASTPRPERVTKWPFLRTRRWRG